MLLALTACVQHLPEPGASVDQVMALRSAPIAAVSVESFTASGSAATRDTGFGVRNYSGLYAKLIDRLIADPEFRAAIAP